MEFFPKVTHIPFMAQRRITAYISILLTVVALGLIAIKGLNFGLDFTGGTQLEVGFSKAVTLEEVRHVLAANQLHAKTTFLDSRKELLIRLSGAAEGSIETIGKKVLDTMQTLDPEAHLRRVEYVGSEVGAALAEQGGLAILVALLGTMIYIALRFEYRLAISAAIALLHDPIVILGFFAATQLEFDLPALASILAVLGYSLNDTIVVFDRVRENFRKMRKLSAIEIMDISINQTLSRTIMTSLLTLLVVVALLIFGGSTLTGFSTAFLIGILIGTYSSIYIAGSLALYLGLSQKDMLVAVKAKDEGEV